MQRQFSFGRLFVLIVVVVALVGGGIFASKLISGNGNPSSPANPAQPNQPTQAQPANPSNPSLPVVPVVPGVQNAAGYYPGQCVPGDARPNLTVAADDYAGFYPVIVQLMTISSDKYCIDFIPKWLGGERYDLSESQIEEKMKSGEIDIYFASNGALSLWDSKSGVVIYSTDQSSGADVILIRDSIASKFKADGTPLPNLNDALGRTILTSCGSADHYFILNALQTAGFAKDEVTIKCTDNPVGDFIAGQGDLTTYWDPIIRDAQALPGVQTLITTKDWRTISDYIVVSQQADANKRDALLYFLAGYNQATEAFTKANLAKTADLLASFTFNGQNMAGWLFIDPAQPYESLSQLVDKVAFSTLYKNVTMFETDGSGWNLVVDQMDKTHAIWQIAGVYDNGDGNKGSRYDSAVFVTDFYVKTLAKNGAKNIEGEFNNEYITDVNENLPNVDNNTLFTLPELFSLKYKYIQFVENQARQLVPGEEEKLKLLFQPAANLMASSPDSVLVLQGSSGFYSSDPAQMAQAAKFAFRRALYIRDILSDPNGLNIPIQRILIDPKVNLPDHYPSTVVDPATGLSELDTYVAVFIRVVNTGNLK